MGLRVILWVVVCQWLSFSLDRTRQQGIMHLCSPWAGFVRRPGLRDKGLSQSYKLCPICKTPAHRNATVCSTCGAGLSDVEPVGDKVVHNGAKPVYDHRYGENDLFEGQLSRRSDVYFVGILLTLAIVVCGGGLVLFGPRIISAFEPAPDPNALVTNTPVPTRGGAAAPVVPVATNTPRPTLQLATVTPAPPTATETPTQGPCMQSVVSGDTLFALAGRCGHRSLDVIPLIVEMNELDSPESLQIGQELNIPWPTATVDPNSVPTQAPDGEDDNAVARLNSETTMEPAERALLTSRVIGTATLQPGVGWHTVASNENILTIAFNYGANIEILSQLNPEITFSQCDFGSASGGPNCIVSVYVGQQVRVPAPTPTPTLSPTPSGSETATPTATATFNAPSLTQPGDRSIFRQNQLVTLRWVATGTLGRNQVYRVYVDDVTQGISYEADTQDLFMIVPEAWQGQELAMRHEYIWRVSVIDKDRPNDPIFETSPRMFTWEALGLRPTETPTP